jgi:hypothetical protein
MYTNNRNAYRQLFFTVWQKHQKKLPLEASEALLLKIMLDHPEYHSFLENPKVYENQEFALEENPFFHMSLHMAVQEQLSAKRPLGIESIYQQLLIRHIDKHQVDHLIMEHINQAMRIAQQTGTIPSDETYLDGLRKIV